MTSDPVTDAATRDSSSHGPLVVMGVSGVGKSTIAHLLGERLGMPYLDADDLHGEANVAKMASGIPLTDEDRMPWLHRVGDALAAEVAPVMACSALKRSYREVLIAHAPHARFVMLAADAERISSQVSARTDHFMPAALLRSQLDTLEPLGVGEPGLVVIVDAQPEALVERIVSLVGARV
ncbi:gluconokinase [Microbacterium sp. W4I4]|uniref:gluconokinase n=1 Tax=Microbacterium sp. W4I4 TaxID=3042295 RepID=UPI00277E3B10|nr:gluconokinase [Microbacterium sp. W4I4]MDQ0614510.1 gluconokinase [Microbacterium sp. W4I4]